MSRCGSALRCVAASLQWLLARAGLLDGGSVGRLVGGTIFLGAGLYQFSALKQACLTLCQRPFPFFFSNWTTEPSGVLRLGLRQGMICLGCCWAMMVLMFAVGAMNVVWMAALGVLMTIEKLATTARFSEAVGFVFVAVGFGMVVLSVCRWRAMDLNEELRVTDAWSLKGELTLSCNCEVFCPCVLSLGQSAPTEGYCLTWAASASTRVISATPICPA